MFDNIMLPKCSLLTYFIVFFLITGTTPRGDTGEGPSSACKHKGPWIQASLHPNICQDVQLHGLTMGREPCYLEQQSFCTDSLVLLMFDNKRYLIKLEMQLLRRLFPAEQSIYRLSVFCVFFSEANQTSDGEE